MTRPQELCFRKDQISQHALYKRRIESAKALKSRLLHLVFGEHNFSPFISMVVCWLVTLFVIWPKNSVCQAYAHSSTEKGQFLVQFITKFSLVSCIG